MILPPIRVCPSVPVYHPNDSARVLTLSEKHTPRVVPMGPAIPPKESRRDSLCRG